MGTEKRCGAGAHDEAAASTEPDRTRDYGKQVS